MAFLDQHPGLGYPAAAAFGLLLGSFLNVVILRLPKRLEWQWKRDAREVLEEPGLCASIARCASCRDSAEAAGAHRSVASTAARREEKFMHVTVR